MGAVEEPTGRAFSLFHNARLCPRLMSAVIFSRAGLRQRRIPVVRPKAYFTDPHLGVIEPHDTREEPPSPSRSGRNGKAGTRRRGAVAAPHQSPHASNFRPNKLLRHREATGSRAAPLGAGTNAPRTSGAFHRPFNAISVDTQLISQSGSTPDLSLRL